MFAGNVYIDYYTNYDEVGNLSVDLKKLDINNSQLTGAEYNIKIVNPDGIVIRKDVTVNNGDGSQGIELTGVSVNVGSYIYLTEKTAPIGYAVNENTETLYVRAIDAKGEITLEHVDDSYRPTRLKLTKLAPTKISDDLVKTNYQIELIDYSLDTFKFGIKAVDSSSLAGIEGYGFKIDSSLGAQSTIETNKNGDGQTIVGGSIENKTITYTITTSKIAQYYKSLGRNIIVKVAFDITGSVDVNKTMQIQTDAGYGRTWTIENLGATSEGPIQIKILIAHQDPLVVTVNTLDEYTGSAIRTAEYKITESFVLPATGNGTINVGYALENGTKTYKLTQTKIGDSYNSISEKIFNITYKNEVIDASLLSITDSDSTEKVSTITKTSARGITINVYAKPKVPFEITNLDYFNKTTTLQGANFEINEVSTTNNVTGTTDARGKTGIYVGRFGTSEDKNI